MKVYRWFILGIGVGLIVLGGFFHPSFKISIYMLTILFILSIPAVAPYLKEAKIPGAKFIFKDEISKTEKIVKVSMEKAKSRPGKKNIRFQTFNIDSAKELLKSDHILALASLRIEIEKKLKTAIVALGLSGGEHAGLSRIADRLAKASILDEEQISAIKRIIDMCNKAIHGTPITYDDAEKIISLAENLNHTFSIGYSVNVLPNREYKTQGLICEWEHCIEWFPLTEKDTQFSCPIFGHNCPGGVNLVSKCKKNKPALWRKSTERMV